MYGDKYRKARAQNFERDLGQARQMLRRLVETEGLQRIDTRCKLCQPTSCTGNCQQGRACDCADGLADQAALYEAKPSLWTRFRSWLERHCIGWEQ
jgi:hypothetical protein